MEKEKQKVMAYVDGFNFYYGLRQSVRWRKYYWLDMVKLMEQFLRPDQELVALKYFSARPDDTEKSYRQNTFFQANQENPKFKLILGKYLKKSITCFNIPMKRRNLMSELPPKSSMMPISTSATLPSSYPLTAT